MILFKLMISKSVLSTQKEENNQYFNVKNIFYSEFIVTQEVTIKVDNTDKIGQLGDKILKTENTKINSFDWGSN